MLEENRLRGEIVSQYGTIRRFAKAIGWSERKTYAIVNGSQEPTASDIEKMCDLLHVEIPYAMKSLFF